MLKYKLQPLINQVSEATNIPLHLVESAISHEFKEIYRYLADPQPTHIGFMLEDLGKFFFKHRAIQSQLQVSIDTFRKGKTPVSIVRGFRMLWKMRHIGFESHIKKNYKKRFGAWHWRKQSDYIKFKDVINED